MNQPSAEENFKSFRSIIGARMEAGASADNIARAILNRYLMIDKSEPIPGAVTFEDMQDYWQKVAVYKNGPLFKSMLEKYDIYPEGTVARLTGEIDRLKGEKDRWEEIAESYRQHSIKGQQKPKAKGCGWFFDSPRKTCGLNGDLCPDCQAKANDSGKAKDDFIPPNPVDVWKRISTGANNPESPDSSKFTLPEVPNWRTFQEDIGNVYEDALYKFMQAVKAHLEGKDV